MNRVIRIVLFLTLSMVSGGVRANAQQASALLAKPNPAPTPIPLAKVPLEAQSALASLQEIDASVSRDESSADGITGSLSNLTGEIDARISDERRLVAGTPSLDILNRLKFTWRNFGDNLSA